MKKGGFVIFGQNFEIPAIVEAVGKEKIAIRKVVDAINSNLQAHFPMKLEQEATDDLK